MHGICHCCCCCRTDNDNYTWTMLNSWGTGLNSRQTRNAGVTADGLFKISMGLAGQPMACWKTTARNTAAYRGAHRRVQNL